MAELNLTLLKSVECAACLEYMRKYIFICAAGHSLCGNCSKLLATCPRCRRRMTNCRNYHLETICKELFYPCEFNSYGCDEFLPTTDEKHHNICSYRPVPCKLTINGMECSWKGPKFKLKDHAVDIHSDKSWMKEDSLDHWTEHKDPAEELQLIQAHGEIFYIYRAAISSMMYWTIQYIGKAENSKKFGYSICVKTYTGDDDIRKITINEICQEDSKTFDEIKESGRYVGINLNALRSFKDKENIVWISIKVIQLPPTDEE